MAVLERFIDYLRAILTIQQDVSELKENTRRLADHLVNAKERLVALEKEVEFLRRELELRDEKIVEQLSRQLESHIAQRESKPKRRLFSDEE